MIDEALNLTTEADLLEFNGICTDSRNICQGQVYIALVGENFNGHDFILSAIENGAKGIVASEPWEHVEGVVDFQVPDTLDALQGLAKYLRKYINPKTVGITGSNGKSSTKEFLKSILSQYGKTVSPKNSFNNHVGVPLTLLEIERDTEYCVVEMGMNHLKEISALAQIADPDVVVVTNVGRAHLEGLGSIDNVALAKKEIYEECPNAVRVFNLDNLFTRGMYDEFQSQGSILTFSNQEDADIHFETTQWGMSGIEVQGKIGAEKGSALVPVFGVHNLENLMAAAACALGVGLKPNEIWKSLPKCKGLWGRNQVVKLKNGATALFDGYNANPESFDTLIGNFEKINLPGRVFIVTGEMLEMGASACELHFELGKLLTRIPFEGVFAIGEHSKDVERGLRSSGFQKTVVIADTYKKEIAVEILNVLQPEDTVLVKGSRGNRLEKLIVDLQPVEFSEKP